MTYTCIYIKKYVYPVSLLLIIKIFTPVCGKNTKVIFGMLQKIFIGHKKYYFQLIVNSINRFNLLISINFQDICTTL